MQNANPAALRVDRLFVEARTPRPAKQRPASGTPPRDYYAQPACPRPLPELTPEQAEAVLIAGLEAYGSP